MLWLYRLQNRADSAMLLRFNLLWVETCTETWSQILNPKNGADAKHLKHSEIVRNTAPNRNGRVRVAAAKLRVRPNLIFAQQSIQQSFRLVTKLGGFPLRGRGILKRGRWLNTRRGTEWQNNRLRFADGFSFNQHLKGHRVRSCGWRNASPKAFSCSKVN